jgi:hypothetical protein
VNECPFPIMLNGVVWRLTVLEALQLIRQLATAGAMVDSSFDPIVEAIDSALEIYP